MKSSISAVGGFVLSIALAGCTSETAESSRPFALTQSFAGEAGSYDYASFDEGTGSLFIGREFGVMKLDTRSGKGATVLPRNGVAAVLLIPGTRLMLSTNSGSDTATVFDRDTGRIVADIPTGKGPDGAFYDPHSGLAFVMNGESGDATLIDVDAAKAVATIKLGDAPEAGVADGRGRAYVNIEASNEIAVVDVAKRAVVARYALPGCAEPTGIAFDATSNLLVSVCHNGVAKLIDAATGNDRGNIVIGLGADGSIFDANSRLGFVPSIDGVLTVYHLDGHGKASAVQKLETRVGARTAAYDPASERLFLPSAIVERDKRGEYLRAKRDFRLLVVSRK